ncbi:major facilitator superfamily protein [Actinidia rufa]|uniref:Major facilitator superfamily protein n=1 Tax=Actinidia rufa TaxID=165716 RepID=A0A7J0H7C6_9ERIC|nr:major facilitator superfamily protein [Actinidia rufa]
MESRARRSLRNHRAAKYGNRVGGLRSKRRRMPYGGCTVNVGDVVEMESQGHLFLILNSERDGRDENHRRCENYGGADELGDVLTSLGEDFIPHQLPPTRDAKATLTMWKPKELLLVLLQVLSISWERDTFGERIEQQARTKTFHHCHDHHLVTRIFHFKDSLIETLDVLMKLATKSLLRLLNESMVLGDNFMNHDLASPFKPFIDEEWRTVREDHGAIIGLPRDVVEIESQGHLILIVIGEVETGEMETSKSDECDENHGRGKNYGGYTGVMSGAMIFIKDDLKINDTQVQILAGILNICALVGALCAGRTSDFIGRRYTIVVASMIFFLGSVLMGYAPTYAVLMVGRCTAGIGVGFALMIAPVYSAEISSASSRALF